MLRGTFFQSSAYYMLQTHKNIKVRYNNSDLELKVSGFYKSLFVREFAEFLHLRKYPKCNV